MACRTAGHPAGRTARLLAVGACLLVWPPASAQNSSVVEGASSGAAAYRLIDEVANTPTLESNLRVLCDEIGGRLPGSDAMRRAISWAIDAFHKAGLTSVHTESFSVPNSWAEGATRAEVISPVRFVIHAAATGWSSPIPNGIEAEVLSGQRGEEGEVERLGAAGKGKIIIIGSEPLNNFQDLGMEQRRATIAMREAEKIGAAAVLFMSTRPQGLLYRQANLVDGRLDKLPSAVVAREDAQRLLRLLEAGRRVRMRLALPNKIGGPFQAKNVVAEIRGAEKPAEVVIVGAHLDSWDLGTGCLDNGCNAALVIEAARAIQAAHLRPKRTIRFILFDGEEEGLLGSRAYVAQHRAELDNIVAVVIHDMGSGRISGYSLGGRGEIEPALDEIMGPVNYLGATNHTNDAFFGTDHFDFLLQGIPTLVANQDTTVYVPNYHAQSDDFDKVDLKELKDQATIAAVTAYNIADRPDRLGKRLTRAQIARLLRETRLDEQLKFLGLWQEWESGRRGRRDGGDSSAR
ncbi:MAG TPA: M20/M25/M40 family metallo-hydrolase [Bryobacterales bacterium]|jgi:carboxypeptidase Q|nr:M20/M25/M40 family metallo-hydrolase [Bryobacterales bacterium]